MDESIFFLLDINECTTGSSRCYQNCHNAVGSYACSCYSGYRLNSDGVSCRGKAINYNFFFIKASVFIPVTLFILYTTKNIFQTVIFLTCHYMRAWIRVLDAPGCYERAAL